jgi:hypothetical protein
MSLLDTTRISSRFLFINDSDCYYVVCLNLIDEVLCNELQKINFLKYPMQFITI